MLTWKDGGTTIVIGYFDGRKKKQRFQTLRLSFLSSTDSFPTSTNAAVAPSRLIYQNTLWPTQMLPS